MNKRGYSLVEMVVALAIIATLLAIGTLRFRDYLVRYRSEAQVRMLYEELLKARLDAICKRRGTRVKLYADRFEVYSSMRDNLSGAAPVAWKQLGFPMTCNIGDLSKGVPLDFESSGLCASSCSICLAQGEGSGAVDSLVISDLTLRVGKRDKGNDCSAANILVR